jgi:glycerophosphoryl diester phosphodiesterase
MRSARKPTHIWTVNHPDEARAMWVLGASGIITDDVPVILAARSRQEAQKAHNREIAL